MLSSLIIDSLHKAGYTNVIKNDNGQEAFDKLCEMKDRGTVLNDVKCIITDIEMPIMDGHRLTNLVKSDDVLKKYRLLFFHLLSMKRCVKR